MKPGRGKRVGLRQWRVLVAADSAGAEGIGDEQVRDAAGRDFSPAQVRGVIKSLLDQGLMLRTWVQGQGCDGGLARYTITDAGAACQLDVAGRTRAREDLELARI